METNATERPHVIDMLPSQEDVRNVSQSSNDKTPAGPTMADRIKQGRRRSTMAVPQTIPQKQTALPQQPKTTLKRKPKPLTTYTTKRAKASPSNKATSASLTQPAVPTARSKTAEPPNKADAQSLQDGFPSRPTGQSTPAFTSETSNTAVPQANPLFQSPGSSADPEQSINPLYNISSLSHDETQPRFDPPLSPPSESIACAIYSTDPDRRPNNDTAGDLAFVQRMMKSLNSKADSKTADVGRRQARRMRALLERARPADNKELLFLTGTEAAAKLSSGIFHNGPILTEGQQPMPLQNIAEFLEEYYDDEATVFVQNPATKTDSGTASVKAVTVADVKKRFSKPCTGRPWNCLELATHVEDGLRPAFLNQEDSRLLTKIKIPSSSDHAGRQKYPEGFKEVEKWALLAQAGALTEPHQDSHGYSTYITVNQGQVGFGWLSYPTAEERARWLQEPHSFMSDRFRYVVLKPGQTVYFPAGTVHFVFRLPSGSDTLAFGGHILRCSNLVHWVKTLLEEKANTDITNEDTTTSAPGYLKRVEKFVRVALASGKAEKWGGFGLINEFLKLKEEFVSG